MRKDSFMRDLERQGFTVTQVGRRNTHIRVTHPNMPGSVIGPSSPSDYRAERNLRAELRRRMRQVLPLSLLHVKHSMRKGTSQWLD
jgi:hypothetical protein